MSLVAALLLMLAGAHVFGRLAVSMRQLPLAGQMLAGIIIGPSVFALLQTSASLAAIADLSVVFVVIIAGLEMRMEQLTQVFRGRGVLALALTFIIPASTAGAFAYATGLSFIPGIVVALCLSVTALPVALQILDSYGLVQTAIARLVISGALLCDVLVLLILGRTTAVALSGSIEGWPERSVLAAAKLLARRGHLDVSSALCMSRSTTPSGPQ